jgi:hypothetical protein
VGLETGTYISDLVVTNPTGSDGKDKGDDHLRLLKSTIKATFPNVNGAVNPTPTEFNYLVGVTSLIQPQIGAKGAIAGQTWTGTHDYIAATLNVFTQTVGDNSSKAASTAFVAAQAFSTALPGQAGNAGKGLTTDGSSASWSSFYPSIAVVQTTGFTAAIKTSYECNTTGGSFTVTLPASPSQGDWVLISDYAGTFGANKLTVGRNGNKIMSLSEDMTVSSNNVSFAIQYVDATKGWALR